MKNYFKAAVNSSMIILLFAGCKQIYDPHLEAKNIRLLVVEGFLNSGQGPSTIRLSRTADLNDTAIKPELGSEVSVEGDNGSNFILTGNTNGEYSNPQLILDNNVKYQLHIKTINGKEYASAYSSVKYTPPIDSITWQRENDGLTIYANARDPQNAIKYYQWKYEETWEFHSAFYSSIIYIKDAQTGKVIAVAYRNADQTPDTTIYKCWNTINSSSIILGSTEKLSAAIVHLPVQYLEPHSVKLSVLYSINLRQYAISHEEYLFLEKMKKNTEQVGSIFDAQPSELSGNIHCLTDPNEIIIGFVEISQEQIKRIFIYNDQVPGWNYTQECFQMKIDANVDSINKKGYNDLYPTEPTSTGAFGVITSLYATNDMFCVYCTLRGTNQKPGFWP